MTVEKRQRSNCPTMLMNDHQSAEWTFVEPDLEAKVK